MTLVASAFRPSCLSVGTGAPTLQEPAVRILLEHLDGATTAKGEIAASLDILAHLIAAQTVIAAACAGRRIADNGTRNWIDAVARDPSTVLNEIKDARGTVTVGDRAEQIANHLLNMPIWRGS
jgi:hypothetical protein